MDTLGTTATVAFTPGTYIVIDAAPFVAFKVPVNSAQEASLRWTSYRNRESLGASEMRTQCGNIYSAGHQLLGHVSYNGRVWDAAGNPLCPDDAIK
jgi:hypothetical protein